MSVACLVSVYLDIGGQSLKSIVYTMPIIYYILQSIVSDSDFSLSLSLSGSLVLVIQCFSCGVPLFNSKRMDVPR